MRMFKIENTYGPNPAVSNRKKLDLIPNYNFTITISTSKLSYVWCIGGGGSKSCIRQHKYLNSMFQINLLWRGGRSKVRKVGNMISR